MKEEHKLILRDITSRKALLCLGLYILFMIVLAILAVKYIDREWLQETFKQKDAWGLLLFGLIEYLYTIFVPIYNTTIHLTAGYIFGGHLGWVLNFITTTVGLFTIVLLVKRFGRPLLEKIVPHSFLRRYDKIATKVGPLTLFMVYVLPLFPDDELTYVITAANIKLSRFIFPILLGNITKAAVSYIGDEGSTGFAPAIGSRVVILVFGIVIIGAQEYFYQKRTKNENN